MSKKIRVVAAYLAAGSGALILLLMVVAHTPPVRNYIFSRVRDLARNRLNIDLQAGSFRYSLLHLSVTLENIRLVAAKPGGGESFLSADAAYVALNGTALLHGRVAVQQARIDGLAIDVLVDEQGASNLPAAASSDTGAASSSGSFDLTYLPASLHVGHGALLYQNRQQHFEIRLPQWSFSLSEVPLRSFATSLQTGAPGTFTCNGDTVPLTSLEFGALMRRDSLGLERLNLVSADSRITLSGKVENFSRPELHLEGNARVNLSSAAGMAGFEEKVGGTVDGVAEVTGPLDRFRVDFLLKGKDLSYQGYRQMDLTTRAQWTRRTGAVEIGELDLKSPLGMVHAQGTLALEPAAGRSRVSAIIENLDLAALSRRFRTPIGVASRAAAMLEASWRGTDLYSLEGNGRLSLRATRATATRNMLPVSGTLRVTAGDDQFHVTVQTLNALGSSWQGRFAVQSGNELNGRLNGAVASASETLSDLERFLGTNSNMPAIKGSLHAAVALGGTFADPQIHAHIQSPGIAGAGLSDVMLQADLSYEQKILKLEPSTFGWQGQALLVEGLVEFGKESPVLDLRASMHDAVLTPLLAGLGFEIPASGTVSLLAGAKGTLSRPEAHASIAVNDFEAYGEALGQLTANAVLEGSTLTLNDFRLQPPPSKGTSSELAADGSYNFDSHAYTLHALGTGLSFAGIRLLGDLPAHGILNLAIDGEGTLSAPFVTARIDVSELSVENWNVGDVHLSADSSGSEVRLRASLPKFNIAAAASVAPHAPYAVKADVSALQTNLALLATPVLQTGGVTGLATADVALSGSLEHWREAAVEARIPDLQMSWNGVTLRNEGTLVFGYRGESIGFDSFSIASGDSILRITGRLPLHAAQPPGKLHVAGDFDLAALVSSLPPQWRQPLAGTLRLEATVSGSLQNLVPSGQVSLREGLYAPALFRTPISGISLDMQVGAGVLQLTKAQAEVGPATLEASGSFPLGLLPENLSVHMEAKPGPASLQVDFHNLRVGDLAWVPLVVAGTVSLHAEAAMPRLGDWHSLQGRATLQEAELETVGYRIRQAMPATIVVQNGIAQIRDFLLSGPETRLSVQGTAALTGDRSLDIHINGNSDLGLAGLFVKQIQLAGDTQLQVDVSGTMAAPDMNGLLTVKQGQARLPSLQLIAQDLNIRLGLKPGKATIENLTGSLNGGPLRGTGYVEYTGLSLSDVHVDATTYGAFLDVYGLRAQVNADLQLRSREDLFLAGGAVHVLQGSYRENIQLGGTLFHFLETGDGGGPLLAESQSPWLSRLRFGVSVDTVQPIQVNNNLAEVAVNADLKLTGSYYHPGMTGRITLDEGGQVYLQENKFYIENGVVTFTNQTKIEPDLNLSARTTVQSYDIALTMNGTPERFSATFSAPNRPNLTQTDVISILLTGKPVDEARTQGLNVAKNQALSFLSGSLSGYLAQSARSTLGLTQVRIEPSFINSESNTPGVRLTLGEDITSFLRLIYSISLTSSNDQIYTIEYDLSRRFFARATRQSDSSYRFDFQHNLPFGGEGRPSPGASAYRRNLKVGNVSFSGDTVFPVKTVADKLGVASGQKYDFFKVQNKIDKLQRWYQSQGHLEMRIASARETEGDVVNLNVHIIAGPQVEFVFKGEHVSGGMRDAVRKLWSEGIFDTQRGEDADNAIRSRLVSDGYLQSSVNHSVLETGPGEKQVVFNVNAGARFHDVAVRFQGASEGVVAGLQSVLDGDSLRTEMFTNPGEVSRALTQFYQQQGYLKAEVQDPKPELDIAGRTGSVLIPVEEGPRYRIDQVEFEGSKVFAAKILQVAARISPGQTYRPDQVRSASYRVQQLYWQHGYNDAVIQESLNLSSRAGYVDVVFNIIENRQQIIQGIAVSGVHETSGAFVKSQITMTEDSPLDYEKANTTRQKLYATGAYSLVTVDAQPAEAGPGLPGAAKPMLVDIKVREPQPFHLRYGGYYDTDRGIGVISDLTMQNVIGSARTVGVRARYDSDLHEFRSYFSQPLLRGHPLSSDIVGFYQRDLSIKGLITDSYGITVQQESSLPHKLHLSYGYRFQHNHSFDVREEGFLDMIFRTSPVVLTLSRDTRNNIFDATKGSFMSQGLEYSNSFLGGDLKYFRYYGQYFHYMPLSRPEEIPFSGGQMAPRWIYAGDLRIGFAWPFGGQTLVPSERFFAGGGTTVRGFDQNAIGPYDPIHQEYLGGNAVFIMNHELRFPLISLLGSAAFLDIGNVYPLVSDFNPFKVRESAGLGLRVRTPYFLLRLDYGFKLNRRPGESIGAFFLNIGQAF